MTAQPGQHPAIGLRLHVQGPDDLLGEKPGACAGCVLRGQPLGQQGDGRLQIAGFAPLHGGEILVQLRTDDADGAVVCGRVQQAQQIVPAAVLGDVGHVLPGGFRPGVGHVLEQGAEQLPLAHALADVAHVEEQLHGQLRRFDVGLVKELDLLLRPAIAHAAGHGEEIQTGLSGGSVGHGAVHGAGEIGFFLQLIAIAHLCFLLSSLLAAFQPPRSALDVASSNCTPEAFPVLVNWPHRPTSPRPVGCGHRSISSPGRWTNGRPAFQLLVTVFPAVQGRLSHAPFVPCPSVNGFPVSGIR